MSRVWTLAVKDLLETSRDRLAFLFIVVMPLAFTLFFGLMFGAASDRLPVVLHNAGGGAASVKLVALLQDSGVLKVEVKSPEEAEKAVDEGKATAAILIPADFSAELAAGRPAPLTLVGVSGSSGVQAVRTEVAALAGRLAAGEAAARAAVAVSGLMRRGPASAPLPDALAAARTRAAEALAHPAATIKVVAAGSAAGQIPTGFVLSSPGMLINFIMFSMLTAGTALIQERRNYTLLRLMTTRLRRWELIAGKTLGMIVLTFVQQIILIGAGQLFFGVDYLRDPAALLLMMIALSLTAASLGLLLAALLSSEQALIATTILVSMGMSALSGAWFPREIAGAAFRAAGSVLPTTWILEGLRGIVLQGFGVEDVLPALGIALAWSAGLFAVAVWRFRLSR